MVANEIMIHVLYIALFGLFEKGKKGEVFPVRETCVRTGFCTGLPM
jgi:hypothetical protein